MGLSANVSAATLSYLRTNTRRLPENRPRIDVGEDSTNKSSQEYYYSCSVRKIDVDNKLCARSCDSTAMQMGQR